MTNEKDLLRKNISLPLMPYQPGTLSFLSFQSTAYWIYRPIGITIEITKCMKLHFWLDFILSTLSVRYSILNLITSSFIHIACNNNLITLSLNLLLRHLKQEIQEFHGKYVFVPADKAAYNSVVVCRLHYINPFKQNLTVPRLTERLLLLRRLSSIAIQLNCLSVISLMLMLRNAKTNSLRCIGYLSFTKDRIKLDSFPTLALAQVQNCLNY